MATKIKIWDEDSKQRAVETIQNLSAETKWKIEIKIDRNLRSLNQNALMWQWVTNVVDEVHEFSGQDKDDIHEFFKQKFLTPKIIEISGETVLRYTTTNLEKGEMSLYMEKIYVWATTELGLILPTPNDLIYGDL